MPCTMHNYSVIWGYAGRIIVRYVNFYRVLALRGICKIFVRRVLCFANVKLCDTLKNVPKRTNEEIFVGPDYRPFILAEGIFDFMIDMIDQYFLVLTTIDLFVLTFMCILTKLSETLNGKQKRGFFLAFVLIGVISILEVITILVDGAPVHLRCLNICRTTSVSPVARGVAVPCVCAGQKAGRPARIQTAVACEAAYLISLALMLPGGMVFSVSEENLYFARRLFRVLRYGVLCRACLSCGLYGHHGACVPESQPRTDLSVHRLSGGGDDHPARAASAARDMAVRHAAFGAVFHLLQ